ncbi:hypothetical protein BOTBODRAFT_99200 [Botryobasidium botryosum FD-172 SS1]|uniref:Tyrosine--tRNA ligase n=1 Tax=Botryobasidium botryosum (strain FD-172 SS1) TaxID=930990 RepID=A0A067NDH6_BOTB1|nr:hypothetical protein BOTBODRAFT_99200 [Botryobasidium botryosum FD-172 SS1]
MLLRYCGRQLARSKSHASRLYSTCIVEELNSRGFIAQLTSQGLSNAAKMPLTVYLGADPSARSLHVGNLLALVGLLHFQMRGHQVISLVGGATGAVGDPGGRTTERKLLTQEELTENTASITRQVHAIFEHGERYARKRQSLSDFPATRPPKVLNNLEWLGGMGFLEFLRTVGKHAKVNVMLTRDSVKSRLASDQGISFTEFSYQLLQAHDFYTLHHKYGCRLQIGGSDQWGNIVAGIDMIKRRKGDEYPSTPTLPLDEDTEPAFGLTIPLLTTASGEKFGKSAGNAVWLDSSLTSVFDFYQFFLRVADADVSKYLKLLTFRSVDEIDTLMAEHERHPERRAAQRMLASEVTELVHGEEGVKQAEATTRALFDTDPSNVRASDVIKALQNDPRLVLVPAAEVLDEPLTKLSSNFKQTRSRSEARKLLLAGGLYLNNSRIQDVNKVLQQSDLIDGRLAILRAGKDNHLIIALEQ